MPQYAYLASQHAMKSSYNPIAEIAYSLAARGGSRLRLYSKIFLCNTSPQKSWLAQKKAFDMERNVCLKFFSSAISFAKSGGGPGLNWLPLSSTTVLLCPATGNMGFSPFQTPGWLGIFLSHTRV